MRERERVRGWLLAVAANEARQTVRRRRRVTVVEIDPPTNPCPPGRIPVGGYGTYWMSAYLIPTGDDSILLVGGSDGVNWPTVSIAIDEIVESMDFE